MDPAPDQFRVLLPPESLRRARTSGTGNNGFSMRLRCGCLYQKIGLEPQFEQLARIAIEFKRRSETGCELNHMWPTRVRDRIPSIRDPQTTAYRLQATIGEPESVRIKRLDVRSGGASRRLLGWRQPFRFYVA
jgi:hypothetical protein